jgi:hypothetical protein
VKIRTELHDLIRAMARRDLGTIDRLTAELDQLGWPAGPQVIGVAFALAVNRRFGEAQGIRDIPQFVAETRSEYEGGEELPALDMEGLIRAALGEAELAEHISPEVSVPIQIVVLGKLLQDANLSEPELEEFVSEVDQVAASYL